MASNEPLLEVENLHKYYASKSSFFERLFGLRNWVQAVDGVSFEIGEGETLGLVGESGCGKSTVGRTILRLEEPTEGTVRFKGQDLSELSRGNLRSLRKEMQIIFQNPHSSLNPRLTINDIIGEAFDIHGHAEGETRDERIKELLELVGLNASHANRYPHEFSGGQLQRIGIARAMAVDPDFIVCDEPVSALDVSVQAKILNLLEELQEKFNISYLFIAHDLSVVEHIADRIAVMYLGEIAEIGTPEELFTPPQHPYTEALLSAIPEPDPGWEADRIILEGTVPSPIDPPSGCKFHTRCPRAIPPKAADLDTETWRGILDLRSRLANGGLPLDLLEEEKEAKVSDAIRDQYDIPRRLEDPEAEQALADVVETALTEEPDVALEAFDEAFPSPCTVHNPELLSVERGRAACHLFDSRYEDGSVDRDL